MFILGAGVMGGGGYLYLLLTQNNLSVRDGKLVSSTTNFIESDIDKITEIEAKESFIGDIGQEGLAVIGESTTITRDDQQVNGDGSASIQGDYNNINIITNQELPGFDKAQGYTDTSTPPDLSRYDQGNDLKQDSLIRDASDYRKIDFEEEIVSIAREIRKSYFRIDADVDASNFIFQLEGSQKAALFQFGLADLISGTNTSTVYTIKFFADGELLWAGECRRSQDSQIISVPLEIPGVRTLVIEVTNNSSPIDDLYFTQALLLRE